MYFHCPQIGEKSGKKKVCTCRSLISIVLEILAILNFCGKGQGDYVEK